MLRGLSGLDDPHLKLSQAAWRRHTSVCRRRQAVASPLLAAAICWCAVRGSWATPRSPRTAWARATHGRPAVACGGVLRLRGAGIVLQQTLDYSAFLAAWPNASIYSCATCGAHISMTSYVLSKKFQGKSGRAYMMRKVVNCYLGPREDRVLIAGLHTVADVRCRCCESLLGWKYLEVFDNHQRLKVGRYVLEKAHIVKVGGKQKVGGAAGQEKEADEPEGAGRREWAGYGVTAATQAGDRERFLREEWGREQGAGEGLAYGSGLSDVRAREGSPYPSRMLDDVVPGAGAGVGQEARGVGAVRGELGTGWALSPPRFYLGEGAWVSMQDALQGSVVVAGSGVRGEEEGLVDQGEESHDVDVGEREGERYLGASL